MTIIAYAFLQHRRLATAKRKKDGPPQQLLNRGLDMGNKILTALADAFAENFTIHLDPLPELSKLSTQNLDLLAQDDNLVAD